MAKTTRNTTAAKKAHNGKAAGKGHDAKAGKAKVVVAKSAKKAEIGRAHV